MSQNYFANTSLTSGERIRNVQLVKSGGYSGLSGHVQHALSRRTKPTETELTHEKNEMLKISGNNTEIIDAEGGMVFPTYCDSHSHLVFAESREEEFIDRIKGLSYQEIASKGGGILNSAKKLQETNEDKLFEDALVRLKNIMKMGTGAVEIKSGYGLTLESEIKMLKVIKRLKENTDITIKSTFLGAHAIPKEFKTNKAGYMDLVINTMLPQVAKENLADYVDIFCEKGYFTIDDTKRLLNAANKLGIKAKTHVNQFNTIGGVKTSVDLGAISVDHLEQMNRNDID